MKRPVLVVLLIIVSVLLLLSVGFAKENGGKKGAHYSGVLIGTGGVSGGASMWIDMYVDEFTTNEKALEYLTVLRDNGQDVVIKELSKKDIGRVVAPTGGNVPIAVARKIESETGTIIRLFIARRMLFLERYEMTRSTDYPVGLIELMLDKDGNGQGAVVAAAKVKITNEGSFELESLGNQYVKIANVRRMD